MFGKTRFGMVEFENKKYNHDIVVGVDGRVYKRDKSPSQKKYGTSHTLSADEVKMVLENHPDVLVVGCGQSGILRVADDLKKLLDEESVELVDLPTPMAIKRFNELEKEGKGVAALIHVTC